MFITKSVGVSGSRIYWMQSKTGKKLFWCKMPVSIFGSFNMSEDEMLKISPFDKRFNDNFVEGKGSSKAEALENMEKELSDLSESLFIN